MSTACAIIFGKLFQSFQRPLIQHVVLRGRRSNAYFISMMRHRASLNPYEPTARSTHLEWNHDAELYAFACRMGEKFDKQVLETVFIDRSHIDSQLKKQEEAGVKLEKVPEDNLKLAETGRIVLRSAVDRYLRTALPKFPEEGIFTVTDHLCGDGISLIIGKALCLDELVLTPVFPCPSEMILKSYYALIGAVYECAGLERAALFVRDFVIAKLSSIELNSLWIPDDPVQYLNSTFEKEGRNQVEPRLIHQCGMNTLMASYRVGMYLDQKYLGAGAEDSLLLLAGNGETVEEAVNLAAMDVLWKLWETTDGRLVIPYNLEPGVFLKTPSPLPFIEETKRESQLQSNSAAA